MDYPKGEQVIMKAVELISKTIDTTKNDKTLYVMRCFGTPLTTANKERYTTSHSYNKAAARVKMINATSENTFGFDYVCLIRGILWGWCGNKSKTYGGAKYASNDVPNTGADQTITEYPDASTTGRADTEPGEVVWATGHIGIYISNGLAVGCTPRWKNRAQITAVGNIGSKAGHNARTWKKHDYISYVGYSGKVDTPIAAPDKKPPTPIAGKEVKGTGVATKFDESLARTYTVTARNSLSIRNAAGTNQSISVSISKGTKAWNYGYYMSLGSVNWLHVRFAYRNVTYIGFCPAAHLKK